MTAPWLILDVFIDIMQTIAIVWALLMMRSAFQEGIQLLRQTLERMEALEKRVERIEDAKNGSDVR